MRPIFLFLVGVGAEGGWDRGWLIPCMFACLCSDVTTSKLFRWPAGVKHKMRNEWATATQLDI